MLDRNESNKKKITAKTKSKSTTLPRKASSNKSTKPKGIKTNTPDGESVIKIALPEAAKSRKTTYTSGKDQKKKPNETIAKIANGSILSPLESNTDSFGAGMDSVVSSMTSQEMNQPAHPNAHETNPSFASSTASQPVPATTKPTEDSTFLMDFEEIYRFTCDMFRASIGAATTLTARPYRIRLKCALDKEEDVNRYAKSRSRCLDEFEDYVTSLKRQHGVIRPAETDLPLFEPSISIVGPQIKKDASSLEKESAEAIRKTLNLEPRKKYALVHEQLGIFVLGGYNLYVDVPIQKEPLTDYLFKSNGETIKIPPIHPCRANFGVFTDGAAIYIAGGQTLRNELLDDIQRLNLQTLKWEFVARLRNPIAASGMTLDENRIYLVGGYEIVQNQTVFLSDYTIYNVSSQQFEKSTDLPTPCCRSLVLAAYNAIYSVSGLTKSHDNDSKRPLVISTDILKWTREKPEWIKVSQTPALTKFHALSFNDPYLEITKRVVNGEGRDVGMETEAHFDLRTNVWANGKAPITPGTTTTAPPPPSSMPSSRPKAKSKETKAPSSSKSKSTRKDNPRKPTAKSKKKT